MKLFCYLFLKSVILLRNKVHAFGGPYLLLFTGAFTVVVIVI